MNRLAKQLNLTDWMANQICRLAQARKLRFDDYIRHAVIRQVMEDIRRKPVESMQGQTVEVEG